MCFLSWKSTSVNIVYVPLLKTSYYTNCLRILHYIYKLFVYKFICWFSGTGIYHSPGDVIDAKRSSGVLTRLLSCERQAVSFLRCMHISDP